MLKLFYESLYSLNIVRRAVTRVTVAAATVLKATASICNPYCIGFGVQTQQITAIPPVMNCSEINRMRARAFFY